MAIAKKILDILPLALASRAFGAVSSIKWVAPVQRIINRGFASMARINREELPQNIDDYESLEALFTRELKDDARKIEDADIVSPVDGTLSFMGKIQDGSFIEAKGQVYSVDKLLGTTMGSEWLHHAWVFTIYLSPANYHRIHSPLNGEVTYMSYVPGRLLPVNRIGYFLCDDLLPSNERLTSFMRSKKGPRAAVVKVGATCVGKISVIYDGIAVNDAVKRKPVFKALEPPYALPAGAQLGCFALGSTVVLIVEDENFVPDPSLELGETMKVGMKLGNWK